MMNLPPKRGVAYGQAFDLLDHHYTFLRQFLPNLLTALEFTGTSAARLVLRATHALKRMDVQGRRRLPADARHPTFSPKNGVRRSKRESAHTAKHLS